MPTWLAQPPSCAASSSNIYADQGPRGKPAAGSNLHHPENQRRRGWQHRAGTLWASIPCGEILGADFQLQPGRNPTFNRTIQRPFQAQADLPSRRFGLAVPAWLQHDFEVEAFTAQSRALGSEICGLSSRPVRILRACLRHPLAELVGGGPPRNRSRVWPSRPGSGVSEPLEAGGEHARVGLLRIATACVAPIVAPRATGRHQEPAHRTPAPGCTLQAQALHPPHSPFRKNRSGALAASTTLHDRAKANGQRRQRSPCWIIPSSTLATEGCGKSPPK